MHFPHALTRFGFIFACFCLLIFATRSQAQADTPSLKIGENIIGELTTNTPTAAFAFTASGGESVTVQLLALSSGFIPRFRLLNPAGVEILAAPNPDALSSLTAAAGFPDAGTYTIEVSGENGTLGQFVLSLQAGAPLPEPAELAADQRVSAAVGGDTPAAIYHFTTTAETTRLAIRSETTESGVLVSLYDETAGKSILSSDAGIRAATYELAADDHAYRLEIHPGSATDTPYTVCLGDCSGGFLATQPQQAAPNQTPEVAAPTCAVASANGGIVNVRSGAGTQFVILGSLSPSQPLAALGRLADSTWLQVSLPNGSQGWVAASVTRLEGDCAALPIVAAPTNAALSPTQPPPTESSSTLPTTMPTTVPPTTAPTVEPTEAPPLPDLSVQIVIASNTPPNSITLYYTLTYSGDPGGPLSPAFSDNVCLDDYCLSVGPTIMSPNTTLSQNVTFSRDIIDPTRRVHQFRVTTDASNSVAESSEGNNVAVYNVEIN